MIGRCVGSTGASLGAPVRGDFYTADTVFHLRVGADYLVLGMGLFETVLLVLVCDDTGLPNWLPIGLFEFGVATMPAEWEFAVLDGRAASGGEGSNPWAARWGYSELVQDSGHSDGLINRDPAALDVFSRELSRLTDGHG